MQHPRRSFYRAQLNVPVSVVWDVFTNHERLGEFTSSPCKIIKPGETERGGLGCVRTIEVPEHGMPDIEEIVNYWVPNKLFGYHVISGAPLSHHQGLVKFFERGPKKSEFVYDMRLIALPEVLVAMPDFYDLLLVDFMQYMKDAEAECERRGEQELFQPPSEPALVSELGGQLRS